jgi:glycolate oxidase iron-sulfur subunit
MILEDYSEVIKKCSQCNFCQAACPVYKAQGSENWLARHRLNLVREVMFDKTMADTARFREIIDKCMLCTSCSQYCSSGVPVDEIIISAREKFIENEKGFSSIKRGVMAKVLREKGARDIMIKAGTFAQKFGIGGNVPKFTSKPFEERMKGVIKAEGERKGSVAYYYGCGTNLMYPETGEALVKLLTMNGYDVILPENITCCGVPVIAEGDISEAAEMMRRNIEALSSIECDAVLMECSSCMMMFMKKSVKLFPKDDAVQEKITSLNVKIKGAMSFLNSIDAVSAGKNDGASFTYHVPCHKEKFSSSEFDAVELVKKSSGAEYRAMDNPESCCGAGGAYYIKNGDISRKIRDPKIREVKDSGAGVVLTECPMCRFYIKNGMPEMDVQHPLEYIAGRVK